MYTNFRPCSENAKVESGNRSHEVAVKNIYVSMSPSIGTNKLRGPKRHLTDSSGPYLLATYIATFCLVSSMGFLSQP